MDESKPPRTPQQRLQTVLKTADLTSATVLQRPPRFDLCCRHSAVVRRRPQPSMSLVVRCRASPLARAVALQGSDLRTSPMNRALAPPFVMEERSNGRLSLAAPTREVSRRADQAHQDKSPQCVRDDWS